MQQTDWHPAYVRLADSTPVSGFARTVAKIGFCAAVAALGLGAFTHTPIRKVIFGADPCIGWWVGSWYGEPVNGTHGGLHEIRVKCSEPDSQIHVFVRLFAQFGAPEYHVLLGPADPTFCSLKCLAVSMESRTADVTLGMSSAIGQLQIASHTILLIIEPA